MKTIALLIVPLLLLPFTTQAQELRLSGGYNGSNVREVGDAGWTGRGGYQLGADLLLGGQLFLRTGAHLVVRDLNYSYYPAGENGLPSETPSDFRYTDRSLRVPAQVGLYLLDPDEDPGLNVYAVGGPSLLYVLNTELSNDALDVETRDAQLYLGAGLGVTLGFVFLEGGYDFALNEQLSTEPTDARVNLYYLQAGVRLQLAR